MRLHNFILATIFFLNAYSVQAQSSVVYTSENEKNLVSGWESSNAKNTTSYKQFSFITDQVSVIDNFYSKHKSELDKKIRDRDSNKKKAETIFKYLHENVFLQYDLNSRVMDLTTSNRYNCVTATSFFVSMAEEFEVPFQIYETPAHVYASITHKDEEIIVELTAPKDGFDFGSNMEALLQTLVDSKLISRDELAEKGPEALYNEYVAETIPISKKQLLGIQYHNDALIKTNLNDYQEAYNQMNKAVLLYPNATFSEAYKYVVNVSQFEFTLNSANKYSLINSLLVSTKTDSVLTYTLVNHLGELLEDLLKFEENFDLVETLLDDVEENILKDAFIEERLNEYFIFMYTSFAQSSSLKGETLQAKKFIEQALEISPGNSRLVTYYVSVTSSHATKLSQIGLFETARSTIDELAATYPEGYPVIKDARVQIILDALIPVPISVENESIILPELELAYSIQPENIYLKSFSATVFHELAMQQVRRSNYQEAKTLVLKGLNYNSTDATLKSDLELINEVLK